MVELVKTGALPGYNFGAAIGSSSIATSLQKSTGQNTSASQWNENGWLTWARRLCPQVDFRHDQVFGYSGMGSDTFLANFGLITGADPKPSFVIIAISSNDASRLSGETFANWFASVTGDYTAMINLAKAAGIQPMIVVQHYRNDYTPASQEWYRQAALFAWARRFLRAMEGVEVVDLSSGLADKTSANNVSPTSKLLSDLVHLSLPGAFDAGALVAAPLDRMFPTRPFAFIGSPGDVWSAENPYGSILNNPGMLGTGGSGGSNIANNWTLVGSAGVTVTPSKVVDADTGWTRQRLTLAGTPSTDGFVVLNGSFVTGALASLTPGMNLMAFCDYKVSGAMTGFRQISIRFGPTDTPGLGGMKNHRDGGTTTTQTEPITKAHSATLRTPPYTVVNAPTASDHAIIIDLINGQAVDYAVDIGPAGVVRV